MKEKTTKEGLPIVDIRTMEAWKRDLQRSDTSTLRKLLEEIRDENPNLAQYIIASSDHYPKAYRMHVTSHLMMLYKILKSQAANNNIEKTFG